MHQTKIKRENMGKYKHSQSTVDYLMQGLGRSIVQCTKRKDAALDELFMLWWGIWAFSRHDNIVQARKWLAGVMGNEAAHKENALQDHLCQEIWTFASHRFFTQLSLWLRPGRGWWWWRVVAAYEKCAAGLSTWGNTYLCKTPRWTGWDNWLSFVQRCWNILWQEIARYGQSWASWPFQ